MLYNGGRVLTYSLIGVLFGIIGKGFSMAGLQQWVSIALGCFIIAIVLLPGRVTSGLDVMTQRVPYIGTVKKAIALLFQQRTLSALTLIGMLNGLLPCGFVYMALAGALTRGSVIGGSVFMILFGMGTIPMMFTVAFSHQLFSAGIRSKIKKSVPAFIVILGAMLIIRGMNIGIPYMSPRFDDKGHIKKSCCQRVHHDL